MEQWPLMEKSPELYCWRIRSRPEAGTVFRHLRSASVAAFLGVDAVVSELKPQDKTAVVEAERPHGPVLMVGDGVNDAPALAAADLGVAMGARGAAASSEAADIVILVDRLDRLVSAVRIARRSRAIALQSVYAGMGMSMAAMVVAALGYLAPIEGALLQEAIDVAVIMNALRALGGPIWNGAKRGMLSTQDLLALEAEHRALADVLDEIRITADRIRQVPKAEIRYQLAKLDALLRERLLPHEWRDDREIYTRIRQQGGGLDVMAGMSRTHMEIPRQIHNLTSLRKALPEAGPSDAQCGEVQRLLYGLEAITALHFAQEEEIYRALESD
jgi:hypothetical protein